jgi:hypothetical protein
VDGLANILCQLLLGSSLEVAANLLFQDYITSRGVKLGEVERERYEVLAAPLMRVRILWDVKLCGWLMVAPV